MKKKSKVLSRLSAVFIAVLCVCALCVPAFAAEDGLIDYGGLTYVDYRTIWAGEITKQYPVVFICGDGIYLFNASGISLSGIDYNLIGTAPFAYKHYYLNASDELEETKSGEMSSADFGNCYEWDEDEIWSNVDIYNENGELVYKSVSPFGEEGGGSIMGEVSTMVDSSIGWIGQFVEVVTSNALLLCFCTLMFVVLGIGLIARIKH